MHYYKKAYIISISSPRDRLDQFYSQNHTNLFEHFEAVVGKNLSPEEINECFDLVKSKQIYHREFALGEIGCTLSHYGIYKQVVADESLSEDDFVLIAEDDLILGENWYEQINELMHKTMHIKDIKFIGLSNYLSHKHDAVVSYSSHTLGFNKQIGARLRLLGSGYKLHPIFKLVTLASALYLIRKSLCRKIISTKPYWLADHFGYNNVSLKDLYYLNRNIGYQNEKFDSIIREEREEIKEKYIEEVAKIRVPKLKMFRNLRLKLKSKYIQFRLKK